MSAPIGNHSALIFEIPPEVDADTRRAVLGLGRGSEPEVEIESVRHGNGFGEVCRLTEVGRTARQSDPHRMQLANAPAAHQFRKCGENLDRNAGGCPFEK